jgi:hypothetical protein
MHAACLNTPETESREASVLEPEQQRIMAENLRLSDQIQMWRAVETLQNQATVGSLTQQRGHYFAGEKCIETMTTIVEEDSVLDNTALDIPSPYRTLSKLASCRFQSCRSLKVQLDSHHAQPRELCLSTSETVMLDGLNPGEHFYYQLPQSCPA